MFDTDKLPLIGRLLIVTGLIAVSSAIYLWYTQISAANTPQTIASLQKRGYIKCGVATNRPGLSLIDLSSEVTSSDALDAPDKELTLYTESKGLEADMCRAVAIGLFGSLEEDGRHHLYFVRTDGGWDDRMNSVVDGTIDIMFRQIAIQKELGATHDVDHGPVVYFERVVLLTKNNYSQADNSTLTGKHICTIKNSFSQKVAETYSKENNQNWILSSNSSEPVEIKTYVESLEEYEAGHCDGIVGRFTSLRTMAINHDMLESHHFLTLANAPTIPTVGITASTAVEFKQLARHSVWTVLSAESNRFNSENVAQGFNSLYWTQQKLNSDNPRRIIQMLGNYAEIYNRNLGDVLPDSGPNAHHQLSQNARLLAP